MSDPFGPLDSVLANTDADRCYTAINDPGSTGVDLGADFLDYLFGPTPPGNSGFLSAVFNGDDRAIKCLAENGIPSSTPNLQSTIDEFPPLLKSFIKSKYNVDLSNPVPFQLYNLNSIFRPDCPLTLNTLYGIFKASRDVTFPIVAAEIKNSLPVIDYYYKLVLLLVFGFSLVSFIVFAIIMVRKSVYSFGQMLMMFIVLLLIMLLLVYTYNQYTVTVVSFGFNRSVDKFFNGVIDDLTLEDFRQTFDDTMTQVRKQQCNRRV